MGGFPLWPPRSTEFFSRAFGVPILLVQLLSPWMRAGDVVRAFPACIEGFMPPICLDPSFLLHSISHRAVLWPLSFQLLGLPWCVGAYDFGEDAISWVVVGQNPDPPTSLSNRIHHPDSTDNSKRELSRTPRKVCRAATTFRLWCLHHLLPVTWLLFLCLWTALRVTGFWVRSVMWVCIICNFSCFNLVLLPHVMCGFRFTVGIMPV